MGVKPCASVTCRALWAERAWASAGTPLGGLLAISSCSRVAALATPSVPLKVAPLVLIAGKPVVDVVDVEMLADDALETGVVLTGPEQAATIAAATTTAEARTSGDTAYITMPTLHFRPRDALVETGHFFSYAGRNVKPASWASTMAATPAGTTTAPGTRLCRKSS